MKHQKSMPPSERLKKIDELTSKIENIYKKIHQNNKYLTFYLDEVRSTIHRIEKSYFNKKIGKESYQETIKESYLQGEMTTNDIEQYHKALYKFIMQEKALFPAPSHFISERDIYLYTNISLQKITQLIKKNQSLAQSIHGIEKDIKNLPSSDKKSTEERPNLQEKSNASDGPMHLSLFNNYKLCEEKYARPPIEKNEQNTNSNSPYPLAVSKMTETQKYRLKIKRLFQIEDSSIPDELENVKIGSIPKPTKP